MLEKKEQFQRYSEFRERFKDVFKEHDFAIDNDQDGGG